MAGFLSRFRKGADTPQPETGPTAAHEATHALQQAAVAPPDDQLDPSMPDKVAAPDFNAEGNDVGMEELNLSHEGLALDEGEADASVKFTLFNEDGTPLRAAVDSNADQETPDGLAQDGEAEDDQGFEAWPAKWKGFTLDGKGTHAAESDSAEALVQDEPVPDDPDEMTTLQPLAEAKEMTGSITYLGPDMSTELGDIGDDDSDPDDLL